MSAAGAALPVGAAAAKSGDALRQRLPASELASVAASAAEAAALSDPAPIWQTSRFALDLSRPLLMGIVNLTPDSFSDGGQYAVSSANHVADPSAALAHCERLLQEGADILDLGAESTRPGATPLPLQAELQRLLPVLRELRSWNVPLSVDTYKPAVMRAALEGGADIINDVWALRQVDASGLRADAVVAQHPQCGVCLMHMHGEPQTMQAQPLDCDAGQVHEHVAAFLRQRALHLQGLGVAAARIVLDPGIGFGKTVAQNFALLAQQRALLQALGGEWPLLLGWSRKSSLGAVTGLAQPAQRLLPSVAAALLALERGARVVRVHDVAATRQALQVWLAARA